MNSGNDKKWKFTQYRITGMGWFLYTIGIFLMLIEFKVYNGAANYYAEFLYKRHCYEKEYESGVERECQVIKVTKDFSDINYYKAPVYFVTLKDVETGKEFKETVIEDPGKEGETRRLTVRKGTFFGENAKKPELEENHSGKFGWLIGTPIVSLLAVFLLAFGIVGYQEVNNKGEDPILLRHSTGDSDKKQQACRIGIFLWVILHTVPIIAMVITSLTIWILI